MIPASFDESNEVLDAPTGLENCDPLAVHTGNNMVVSCWKVTPEELTEINRTGRVWLVLWGRSMPPAALYGIKPKMSESNQGG